MNDIATIALTTFGNDEEPRIRDTDLGTRLGMTQPLDIRRTITKHAEDLADYGLVRAACEPSVSGRGRVQDTTVYYLNERQALYIAGLAKTAVGKQVYKALIEVFTAWRAGKLVPAKPSLPDFTNPVEAARAWADQYEQRLSLEKKVEEAAPKVAFVERYVETKDLFSVSQVAQLLGFRSAQALNKMLLAEGVITQHGCGRGYRPTAKVEGKGYFSVKTGSSAGHSWTHTKFTSRGVEWATRQWGG